MDHKTITLNGGNSVPVIFEDGRTETLTVKQFRLKDYSLIFPMADDELALVAFAVGQPKGVAETLTPESFEVLLAVVKEVNKHGFFCYADRQRAERVETMRTMPPAVLEKIMAKFTSSTPSPTWPPTRG